MSQRIAIVIAGSGVKDGSEIHESVLTLLALSKRGVTPLFFAPDKAQADVVNHLTATQQTKESRNCLIEAARIARGAIRPLSEARADALDAVILPGGYGAAKNLCDYAVKGTAMSVDPELDALLVAMHAAKKPIGVICIAPVIAAKVFGSRQIPVELTVGTDPSTMSHLEAMGARPKPARVDEIVLDKTHRIVSTPAYMLAKTIAEAASGIDKLVAQVLDWA